MTDPDKHIRAAAFVAIEKISRQWGGQVPWDAIRTGFQVGGEGVLFANKVTGIFKPKQMSAALSIKTTVPRTGRSRWYRDQDLDSNLDHDTGLLRKDLDGTQLRLPREQEDWPNRDFLEHRFVRFRNSSS